jgi:hypothetical protein
MVVTVADVALRCSRRSMTGPASGSIRPGNRVLMTRIAVEIAVTTVSAAERPLHDSCRRNIP